MTKKNKLTKKTVASWGQELINKHGAAMTKMAHQCDLMEMKTVGDVRAFFKDVAGLGQVEAVLLKRRNLGKSTLQAFKAVNAATAILDNVRVWDLARPIKTARRLAYKKVTDGQARLRYLMNCLENLSLGEKLDVSVVVLETGEVIIPPGRKITKALIRKAVKHAGHIGFQADDIRDCQKGLAGKMVRAFGEYNNMAVEVVGTSDGAFSDLQEKERKADPQVHRQTEAELIVNLKDKCRYSDVKAEQMRTTIKNLEGVNMAKEAEVKRLTIEEPANFRTDDAEYVLDLFGYYLFRAFIKFERPMTRDFLISDAQSLAQKKSPWWRVGFSEFGKALDDCIKANLVVVQLVEVQNDIGYKKKEDQDWARNCLEKNHHPDRGYMDHAYWLAPAGFCKYREFSFRKACRRLKEKNWE